MYQTTTLSSGLTVATAHMPHMKSVSLGVWVGTGGRHESEPLNGVSHFIEHLMFKGTRKRSARDISVAIEGIGGDLNAFTAEENTCYYAKAPAPRWPDLLDVLMDMYLDAQFAPREIRLERSVIKEEIALYRDQPHQHVLEMLNEILWPGHPLGRCLTGTPTSVDGISRARMMEYRKAHYVAANTLVCAAGPFSHEALVRRVRRTSRGLAVGQRPVYLPAGSANGRARFKLDRRRIQQVQIAIGFPTCSRHDSRRFALRLLNTLLGENMSSRLFQVIREKHGLVYSISSSSSLFDDVGVLTLAAGLDLPQLPRVLRLLSRELARLKQSSPGRSELSQAREYLMGQLDLNLESTESQMMWMGESLLGYGRITRPERVKKRLLEVTPAHILQVARDFLNHDAMRVALVGPSPGMMNPMEALEF